MAFPLVGAGAVLSGAGLVGSLVNARKKVRAPDLSPLIAQAQQSEKEQLATIRGFSSRLPKLTENYRADVTTNLAKRQAEARARGQQFQADAEDATGERTKMESGILRQRVLEAQPELQNQLRESLAATGGLNRGSASTAFTNLATEAGRQIGQGEQELALERVRAKERALETVFNSDDRFIRDALGIEKEVALAVLNSGRDDLIQEMNAILDSQRTRQSTVASLSGQQIQNDFAGRLADRQSRNEVFQQLTGLGGTLVGLGSVRRSDGVVTPTAPDVSQLGEDDLETLLIRRMHNLRRGGGGVAGTVS